MKELSSSQIDEYYDKGYIVIKNLINEDSIVKINRLVDNLEPKVFIPYSEDVPWGYGNLIDNSEMVSLSSKLEIEKVSKTLLSPGKLKCNHLLVVNKAAYIGPDVEWHQEFFNIDTYAPGYSSKKDLNKFIQVFIALDKHNESNGPLCIFEESHKEGLLEHEDIVNCNLGHKRRVKYSQLCEISSRRKLKQVLLDPGDALFFNHLLVHGSPTNTSNQRRRALLYQLRISDTIKDNKLFDYETNYRKKFIIDSCSKIISKLTKNNPYLDMRK